MMIYLLKSGLCMGILLLFYHLILEKESMYRFNRFYLLGALIFSLAVPFLTSPIQWQMPDTDRNAFSSSFQIDAPDPIQVYESAPSFHATPAPITDLKPWYFTHWLLIIYSMVTVILMVRFLAQLMNFNRIIKRHPVVSWDGYQIVLLLQNSLPFTFFNYLFVSAESYHAGDIEQEIWEHELAHIREKHSWDIMLVEVMKVVLWFNPFIYFYKKAIQLNHEFLADRAVTASFTNIPKYQSLLINKTAVNNGVYQLSSPFNYTITKKRLKMMYKKTSSGKSALVQISLLPLVFLLTGFLGTAAHQVSDPSMATSAPIDGSLTTQYEYYINEAIDVQKPNVLLLEKLNIDGIKQVYRQMSAEEKEHVSYFPFLEDEETVESLRLLQGLPDPYAVEFVFSAPPAKKSISSEVWSAWREAPAIEVEIDGIKVPREKLADYSPTDFSLFNAREEKVSGNGNVVKIDLSTHEYYYHKHVKVVKRVIGINARYMDSTHLQIPYGMISFRIVNGINKESMPANLPLSILDELINPGTKRKNIMDLNKDQGFSISVIEGKSTKSLYVITN